MPNKPILAKRSYAALLPTSSLTESRPASSLTAIQQFKANLIRKSHPDFNGIPDSCFKFSYGGGQYSDINDFCTVTYKSKITGKIETFFVKCAGLQERDRIEHKKFLYEEAFFNYLTLRVQNYKRPTVYYDEIDNHFVYVSKHLMHQNRDNVIRNLTPTKNIDPKKIDLDNFVRKFAKDWFIFGNFDSKLDNSVAIKTDDGRLKLYTIDVFLSMRRFQKNTDIVSAFYENVGYFVTDPMLKMKDRKFYSDLQRLLPRGPSSDKIILSALQKLVSGHSAISGHIKDLRADKKFQDLTFKDLTRKRVLREASDKVFALFENNANYVQQAIKDATSKYNKQNPENRILSYKEQREEKKRERAEKQMAILTKMAGNRIVVAPSRISVAHELQRKKIEYQPVNPVHRVPKTNGYGRFY